MHTAHAPASPKVVYNQHSGLYVLWANYMHWPSPYKTGYYLTATARVPEGPFTVVNKNVQMSQKSGILGDFDLMIDDDEEAYMIYTVRAPLIYEGYRFLCSLSARHPRCASVDIDCPPPTRRLKHAHTSLAGMETGWTTRRASNPHVGGTPDRQLFLINQGGGPSLVGYGALPSLTASPPPSNQGGGPSLVGSGARFSTGICIRGCHCVSRLCSA
jgi:hypothetical protein